MSVGDWEASAAVYFLGPPGAALPKSLMQTCTENDWSVEGRSAVIASSTMGRTREFVTRMDAYDLYVLSHKRPVAIVHSGGLHVRRSPVAAFRERDVVPLEAFFRYEAFSVHVDSDDFAGWDRRFRRWSAAVWCTSPTDPRCLPMHIFNSALAAGLDEDRKRKQFVAGHSHPTAPGSRIDDERFRWEAAPVEGRHAVRDPITIGGRAMEDGYHWDVTSSGRKAINAVSTVWRVNGHLNIYPDGCVRKGTRTPCEHSADDSKRFDERDRQKTALRLSANNPAQGS